MTRQVPQHIAAGYGRSKPRNYEEEKAQSDSPRCQRCRSLAFDDPPPALTCRKGHALGSAASCGDFSDASRQRDFFPNFFHPLMRR